MQVHDALAAVGILVGLMGIVVVVVPGLLIVAGSVLIWALIEGGATGIAVGVLAAAVAVVTAVLKYQRPGRRLVDSGVPTGHLIMAAIAGVVGLFVVPVVGAPLFFVGAIYVLALARLGRDRAWPATKSAMRAVIHSVGIELAGAGLIALIWLVGVLA